MWRDSPKQEMGQAEAHGYGLLGCGIVHGGELAGLTTIAFEWESADASIAGSDAINADSQMVQMMGDTGVSVLRRTLFGVMGERGDRSGDYVSGVYGLTNSPQTVWILVGPRSKTTSTAP